MMQLTDAAFRQMALALPAVQQSAHFGKVDFRVKDKIFAGFMADGAAYVKLTPDQQQMICAAEPQVTPIPGGWGRKGWSRLDLAPADAALVQSLLLTAWRNVAPKSMQKGSG